MYILRHMLILILVACSLELFGVSHAYPALLPYIYNPTHSEHARTVMKRNELSFSHIEDDVAELEQLRNDHNVDHLPAVKRQHETTTSADKDDEHDGTIVEAVLAPNVEDAISHTNTLPDLERQLELATPLMPGTTTTTTSSAAAASKEEIERTQVEDPKTAVKTPSPQIVEALPPASGKAFYGAARLAFGQNPEVLPTSSTSTTTTTAAAVVTTNAVTTAVPPPTSPPILTTVAGTTSQTIFKDIANEELERTEAVISEIAGNGENEHQQVAAEVAVSELSKARSKSQLNKETIGDILIDQLASAKTTERRSSMQLSPKTAQSLLRNPNGQYSSFDMAQYVFWTGDEAGVARAVEELIDQDLISRENALKFLRDIRLGIEFLQRSYANRIFPDELRQNHLKRNNPPSTTTTSTSTTTTSTTTTAKPLPYLHLEQELDAIQQEGQQLPHIEPTTKSMDSLTFWNKLRELSNEGRQDIGDYDDPASRAHLYNEYTLEEILYKLAKVMFAQSLAHGSDEAQQELQKLTDFLEREGNLGVIPVDLQKKVLRVLLSALSDTLSEHPELLPAARLNLANPYYRLPMHTPSH